VAYYPYKYIAEFDGVPSSKSCQEYCGRKEGCQYYLYSKISKKCWLKDSKGTRMPNKGYGFVFGPRTDLPPEPVFTCDEKASSLPMELNGTPDNFAVRVKVPGSSKSCMLQVGDVGEMYIDCEPESALNLPSTFTMEPV
jgi:PAN domain